MPGTVRAVQRLAPEEVAAVLRIVDAATAVDGTTPVDEHVLLHLRHADAGAPGEDLLVEEGADVVGYAHLDPSPDPVGSGVSAQLVVDPARRGHGYGRRLIEALDARVPDGSLRLWAHGERSDVVRLVAALGFTRSRVLWQLRRSLAGLIPEPELPAGVTVRTFQPSRDDEAWVALNALAFATHPEQGRLTLADLRQRLAEPWFDPEGFFLAERGEPGERRLVGFHWTKVQGAPPIGKGPIGEVYVLGVHPDERGSGLGRALTLVGLHHLRSAGLADVLLYVDADNASAVRLYERLGFTRYDTDVLFQRPSPERA